MPRCSLMSMGTPLFYFKIEVLIWEIFRGQSLNENILPLLFQRNYLKESGIHRCGIRNPQTWNPDSTAWNPESKTLLNYLTWGHVWTRLKSYNAHSSSSQWKVQISCQVLWMKTLSSRPVLHFLQAQKVLPLEFFMRKMRSSFFKIPAASNEQFVFDCHVGNLQVFMGNNSAGFH